MESIRDQRIRQRRRDLEQMTVQDHIDAAAEADANYPSDSGRTAAWNLSVIKHLMWAQVKAAGGFPGSAS